MRHRVTITPAATETESHLVCSAKDCYLSSGFDVRKTAATPLALTHENGQAQRAEACRLYTILGIVYIALLVIGLLVGFVWGRYL